MRFLAQKLAVIRALCSLYPWLYEWVIERGGSMSAEHGIGRLKRVYHHALVDPNLQRLNSQMKRVFDPRALLSPYKMVD